MVHLYPIFESQIDALRKAYISAQLMGWSTYILIAMVLNSLRGQTLSIEFLGLLTFTFFFGLILSHVYRKLILRNGWLNLSIKGMIVRFLLGSLVFGFIFEILHLGVSALLIGTHHIHRIDLIVQEFTGWSLLFLFWSVVYFFYHFFITHKQEEIKNLKLEAAQAEMELNRLKSQLNPHFIFNAMNSIRALVDEDGKKAKDAVTRLSNILRNSLQADRDHLISLGDELKIVEDYLALEKMRYEERLNIQIDIPLQFMHFYLPPMLLQTLAENAVKHGISQLPKGGLLRISAADLGESWELRLDNSGRLQEPTGARKGIGLINTVERLKLLFGNAAKLHLSSDTQREMVITRVVIPKTQNPNK